MPSLSDSLRLGLLGFPPAWCAAAAPFAAADIPVATPAGFTTAIRDAGPGDVLLLRSGTWADARLAARRSGSATQPLTIRAERPGCLVVHNLIERCDGEAECISNKSSGDTYRHNLFRAASGALTLRHGDDCRVEHDAFLGETAAATGGVRIVGSGHAMIANHFADHFADLRGDDHRSAVCLMLGIPDPPDDWHARIRRVRIEDNTFVDCEHNVLIGMRGDRKATLRPADCVIARNSIDTRRGPAFDTRCATDGIRFADNTTAHAAAAGPAPTGTDGHVGPAWRR